MPKFLVTLQEVRNVYYLTEVEVEAEDEDEAEEKALAMAEDGKVDFGDYEDEEPSGDRWVEHVERVNDA